jgi:CarD family transcriptional regulator, regulator of rRNA transcription
VVRTRGWRARVGDLAVYPGQGVTRVEAFQKQEIAGQWCEFVVLRKLDDQSRILVPRERIPDVGLRRVVATGERERVWEVLRAASPDRPDQAWSRQFRDYQDKLREGSIFEIAAMLRDLTRLALSKELSFGERRVLESARALLVQELAAAQDEPASAIEARVLEAVG